MRVVLFALAFASCTALRTAGRPLGRAQLLSQRAPVLSLAEPDMEPTAASPVPPSAPMDPRKAVEEMGSLVKQIQELWTDGKNWGVEERATRRLGGGQFVRGRVRACRRLLWRAAHVFDR